MVTAHRDRLTRYRSSGRCSQEQGHVGYFLRRDHVPKRNRGHKLLHRLIESLAACRGPRFNDLTDSIAFDDARKDRVDADTVGAEFYRDALCKSNHSPLRGGIGTPQGKTDSSGDGGEIDYAAASGRSEMRHCEPSAVEDATKVYSDCSIPVFKADVLNL